VIEYPGILAPDTVLAMELLAVSEDGLTPTQLGKLLSELGPRPVRHTKESLERVLEAPHAQGLVGQEERVLLGGGVGEPIVRRLIREGRYRAMVEAVAKVDPLQAGWGVYHAREGMVRREVRRALLDSDWERYRQLYRLRHIPVLPFLTRPLEVELVRALHGPFAIFVLDELSTWTFEEVVPVPGLLDLAVERARALHAQEPSYAALAAVRLAALEGKLELLQEMLELTDLPRLHGLFALLQGKLKPAVTLLAKQLAAERGQYRRRDVVLGGIEGALLPLAYLLEGSPTRVKQAQVMIESVRDDLAKDLHREHIGWLHLARWVDPSLPAPSSGDHPFAVWMEGLARSWSSLPPQAARLSVAIHRAEACGWAWMAAELRALTGGPAWPGTTPLVSHRQAVAPWQTRLVGLEQLLDGVAQPQSRISWYVSHPLQIEAREHTRQRAGWSVGKKVAWQRLLGQGKKLELSEADQRVARCLRSQQGWRGPEPVWAVPDVYRELASHPHVFTSSGHPLTIALLRPRIEVVRAEGKLTGTEPARLQTVELTVVPEPPQEGVRVEVVGDRGLEVTAFDTRQTEIARKLAGGIKLPAEPADRVEGLLARLGELFEISDRDAGPALIEGDPAPVVQLWPEAGAVQARIVVRPVGASGPALVPGEGSPLVLALLEGKPHRATRHLSEEKQRVGLLLQSVPALVPPYPGATAPLPDLAAVLEVLDALRREQPPVVVEWPQGAEIRLRGASSGSRLSVAVRQTGDWFSARGQLAVDEDLELPLSDLLARVAASHSRFVQLDDGSWLALTEQLRHKLDSMTRIARVHEDEVELHPLAAPLLQDLVEEAKDARTDVSFRRHLQRQGEDLPDPELPAGLQAELRPYQVDGFRWLVRLAHLGAGACLADDMGLGKTVMTLGLLLHRASEGPALVVAPTSVCAGWRTEAWRFAPDLRILEVTDGATAASMEEPGPSDVVICSYGLLVSALESLSRFRWATVIADEAQAIKNPDTHRHRAVLRVGGAFRVALTGTPVENHLGDLWSLFAFLNPGLLGQQSQFAKRFGGPLEQGDRVVQQQLHRLVSPFVLRRTKASVLSDLPPRTVIDWRVELGPAQAAIYEAVRKEALAAVEEGGKDAVQLLAHLTRLRLAACHPRLVSELAEMGSAKLAAFGEMVESLQAGRHRALVFSQFVRHLQLVREQLDADGVPYQYLDGETPAKERQRRVEAFQRGEGLLFLISLRAGGFGLNLTGADYVVHLDPWWNPAVEDQASDRAHRIGQTRPVTVYRLVAKGTIEERILELHRTKRDLADRLLAGTDAAGRLTSEEMLSLLRTAGA
jgi:superfamily II DNA or RNA helicase